MALTGNRAGRAAAMCRALGSLVLGSLALCCLALTSIGCSFDTSGAGGNGSAGIATESNGATTTDGPTATESGGVSSGPLGTTNSTGRVSTSDASESSGVGPECQNGELDPPETEIDCGGECAGCPNGSTCVVPTDCASRVCVSDECAESRCDDGVVGGEETDIDCGGPCERCATGRACLDDPDCVEDVCFASVCLSAACNDGMRNGDESDIDCGGSCGLCGLGDACLAPSDCFNSSCVEETCGCDQAFSNGDFEDGLTAWVATSGGCWHMENGQAACTTDEVSGHELAQAVRCFCLAAPAPVVLRFSVRWQHDNAGDLVSGDARLSVAIDGVVYAVIQTANSDGSSASVTYSEGATGNVTSILVGQTVPFELTVPAFIVPKPVLTLSVASSYWGDDFFLDDFILEGVPCPS